MFSQEGGLAPANGSMALPPGHKDRSKVVYLCWWSATLSGRGQVALPD